MKDINNTSTTDESNNNIMSKNRSPAIENDNTKISTKTVISSEVTSAQQVTQCYSDGTGLYIDFLNNTIDRMERIAEELQTNTTPTTNQQRQTQSYIMSVNFPVNNPSNVQQLNEQNNINQPPAMIPIYFRTTRIQQSDLAPEEQELYHKAELLNKSYNTRYSKVHSNTHRQFNIRQKLMEPLLRIFSNK